MTVVSLTGGAVTAEGPAPHDDVIAALERMLRRARAGEVRGFAIVIVNPSGRPSQMVAWGDANCFALHSGCVVLCDEIGDTFELVDAEDPV